MMTGDQSHWVADYFTACSCEVTPSATRAVARVLHAPFSREPAVTDRCASVLSKDELQRAGRFRDANEKAGFIQRRAFRRFCGLLALCSVQPLSRHAFQESGNGRPYLSGAPEIGFSFSACRSGFMGAWSSTHGVGVDIENQNRDIEASALAHSYFSEAEAVAVEGQGGQKRLQTFYRFWTLKEAALKSIGEGLPFGLSAFQFELNPAIRMTQAPAQHGGAGQFAAHAVEVVDHSAALVLQNPA